MTASFPKLSTKGRLKYDQIREKHLLLLPEKVVVLNETAASILALCDGNETIHTITGKLRDSLMEGSENTETEALPSFEKMKREITQFLHDMVDYGWVVIQYDRVKDK
ncbi:hypothetical protein GCM10008986_20890 [Salinibacillus aidingensis]|uniref:Pyrroloquinoline quinone biosynthesis peptide chaperone PqqD n=1 Tax=Salinibacillus aidingensis TaxID=237684 RepID=A0ABN1BC75_9BACI